MIKLILSHIKLLIEHDILFLTLIPDNDIDFDKLIYI